MSPRNDNGYSLDDLKKKVLRASLKRPLTAREIAGRVGLDGYDGRALGRPIGALVREGKLLKHAARVPLYSKAR